MNAPPLVTTDWLAERLADPRVRVVDATWFMPGQGDARAAYLDAHVPGAVHFDIDQIADRTSELPHMLPTPQAFAEAVSRLGIGGEHHVVAYGLAGPRVWWMFRAMGHDAVSVMDGGLAKWRIEERPTQSGLPPPRIAQFTPRYRPELVAGFDTVQAALAAKRPVIDARPADRFRGDAPEPRPGLKSGHMPGARSLPSTGLFNPGGTFRSQTDTGATLAALELPADQPAIATCGSGVTAAMVALAMARLGRWDTAVYDGSWSEWGGRADAAVVTGRT